MRLVDCCVDVFAFVTQTSRQASADYETARATLEQLLGEAEARAVGAGFSTEDWNAALFAMVAWADEAFMNAQWPDAARWRKEPLQKVRFNTTRAGVEFFTRLDALTPNQKQVREVYYLCLVQGFKGRYVYAADAQALASVKRRNLGLLVGEGVGDKLEGAGPLFPGAYPPSGPEDAAGRRGRRVSGLVLSLVVTPAVVVFALYVAYDLTLSSMVGRFASLMK